VLDFLEYLGEDPETEIILSYLEGVNDGRRFNRLTRAISLKKPIIIWKCGSSEVGAKAAASHTGAMAGSHKIWEGVLENNGIISVKSFEEMIDCAYAFHNIPLPQGNRIAIITGPGGPAVGTTDACIGMGLEVPPLSKNTQGKLMKAVPPVGTSLGNPIDLSMVAAVAPELYGEVIKIIGEDDHIDMMIAIGNGGDVFYDGIIEAVEQIHKPVALTVLMPTKTFVEGHKKLSGTHTVVYPDPIRAARALSRMAQYANYRRKHTKKMV
jgi:acetyltransferase